MILLTTNASKNAAFRKNNTISTNDVALADSLPLSLCKICSPEIFATQAVQEKVDAEVHVVEKLRKLLQTVEGATEESLWRGEGDYNTINSDAMTAGKRRRAWLEFALF